MTSSTRCVLYGLSLSFCGPTIYERHIEYGIFGEGSHILTNQKR